MKPPRKPFIWLGFLAFALSGLAGWQHKQRAIANAAEAAREEEREAKAKATLAAEELQDFATLLGNDPSAIGFALMRIDSRWHDAAAVMTLESMRLAPSPAMARGGNTLLRQRLGVDHGNDVNKWYRRIWQDDEPTYPGYAAFKAELYGSTVDERFRRYFASGRKRTIRLDEIRWGGVKQNGIPPLTDPTMLSADEAAYLADSDMVFGVSSGGRAKAYPKRILAWHEMVNDSIGGESITGVYCTLCGAMIVYKSVANDIDYVFGTSGFLYRSNKLMFDENTHSLWSSLKGEPVVGPLVGKGLKLETLPVITTTWGQWKNDHPHTLVLSPETGFKRDYGEGVAYRNYFASDKVMFSVPKMDNRLNTKDEVLIIRDGNQSTDPTAIDIRLLQEEPIYQGSIGDQRFVVVTDKAGGCKAYTAGDWMFHQADDGSIIDGNGQRWQADDSALRNLDDTEAASLKRLPSHRAFWFAWFSQNPDTKLIRQQKGNAP